MLDYRHLRFAALLQRRRDRVTIIASRDDLERKSGRGTIAIAYENGCGTDIGYGPETKTQSLY